MDKETKAKLDEMETSSGCSFFVIYMTVLVLVVFGFIWIERQVKAGKLEWWPSVPTQRENN